MAIIIEEICFAPGRKRVKTLLRAPARYTRSTVKARLNPLCPLHQSKSDHFFQKRHTLKLKYINERIIHIESYYTTGLLKVKID